MSDPYFIFESMYQPNPPPNQNYQYGYNPYNPNEPNQNNNNPYSKSSTI